MPQRCHFCSNELGDAETHCPHCGQPAATADTDGPAVLFVREPFRRLRKIALEQDSFTIGRLPDNDIVLPAGYVSSHHGRLERQAGVWTYTDLDSTNGSFVNGEPATHVTLHDGDILRIGDLQGNSVSLTLRIGRPEDLAAAPTPVHKEMTALHLQPSLLIGRDPQAEVHVSAPTVSWHHARLEQADGGHVLVDLNSTNGTFVNGERVERPHRLREGDEVQIGPHRLVYRAGALEQYSIAAGMRLDGLGLVWEVGRGSRRRTIIKGIDISVYPREFIAIVGTSGAGKSTLLKALNGFHRAQGQVLVNGDDLYRRFDLYRSILGYVPQDDIIHDGLTVTGTLRYAALLRLPPDTSAAEIDARIEQVLRQVGMLEQRDNPITRLSGGQRKRVNIAVELLAEPRLFFLDEPTSGLDPGLEKKMMHTLRHLADQGRTVVLVTHATANIATCDHVCFLAKGRLVYFGPPEEALAFFGIPDGDMSDIYDLLDDPDPAQARAKAEEWEYRFRASSDYRRYVADRHATLTATEKSAAPETTHQRPKVNPLRQYMVLTRRYLHLVMRDRLLMAVLLAVMPAIALLLLLIAERNWLVGDSLAEIERLLGGALDAGQQSATYAVVGASQTLLFMLSLSAVLLGLFAAAYEIVKERSILLRERMINLRLLPYVGSKVTVLGGFAALQCLLLLAVLSLKVDLPRVGVLTGAPVEMYVSLLLGALASIMLGLFISSLVPNTNSVIYIILLALFFQIIFAGVFFELPGVVNRLSYATLSRWVVEGLGRSTDLERLNNLTRTRFQPEPITDTVQVPMERLAPDYEPATVITETRQIEVTIETGVVRTVAVEVPRVVINEPMTVTRFVAHEFTLEPRPVDIYSRGHMQIDYTRSAAHLWRAWGVLLGFVVALGVGTLIVLEARDVW